MKHSEKTNTQQNKAFQTENLAPGAELLKLSPVAQLCQSEGDITSTSPNINLACVELSYISAVILLEFISFMYKLLFWHRTITSE